VGLGDASDGGAAADRGLVARLEQSLVRLEREKRVVETLHRVTEAVAREQDLGEIAQRVADETTAITGAELGAFVYSPEGREGEPFTLFAISGVPR